MSTNATNKYTACGQTFSHAPRTVSWLGPEDESTAHAFAVINRVAASCRYKDPSKCEGRSDCHFDLSHHDIACFESAMTREYFDRTWIIQEFLLCPHLFITCGRYSTTATNLLHLRWLWPDTQAGSLLQDRYYHAFRDAAFRDSILRTAVGSLALLSKTFGIYARSRCTDPRDRVFAFLGSSMTRIIDTKMRFVPDYNLGLGSLAVKFAAYCDELYSERRRSLTDEDPMAIWDLLGAKIEPLVWEVRRLIDSIEIALLPPKVIGLWTGDAYEAMSQTGLVELQMSVAGPVVQELLHPSLPLNISLFQKRLSKHDLEMLHETKDGDELVQRSRS